MKISRRDLIIGAGAAGAVPGSAEARTIGIGGSRTAARSGGTVVPPTPPGSPFITSTTVGAPRSDALTAWRGFRFTVGSLPLLVTDIGRWVGTLNGSTHTHQLGIYYQNSSFQGVLMFGSGVTVDISSATPNTYAYVSLSSNVILWPGTQYWVTSFEPGGGTGDIWYGSGFDGTFTTTADATMNSAAYFDPSTNSLVDQGSGGNHPQVPVNFKYTTMSFNFVVGSGFTQYHAFSQWFYAPDTVGVVSGVLTIGATQVYSPINNGSGIYEWVVWDGTGTLVKRSGALAGSNPPAGGHKFLEWVFDTTTLPDGTYVYYPRFLDWSSQPLYQILAAAGTIIIANHPPVSTGTQGVPFAGTSNHEIPSARPDFLTYTGVTLPPKTTYGLPYSFVPGSNSTALRSQFNWFAQSIGPRAQEYQVIPEWATNFGVGGVFVTYPQSTIENSTPAAYPFVVTLNTFSGTRTNNLVSPGTTYVEDPAGGGVWWGAELGGRIFKQHANGDVENIVGWERDTSTLNFPQASTSEDNYPRTLIGTFPVDLDLGGANDLCFDPRDSNILYVVSQVDHWIAKVVINTKTITVYAGTPGTNGYTGDGGAATSATFNNPSSIIMSDGTGNGGPAGTMYVADSINNAIRKITPGGTISTLCGGTLSPGPIINVGGTTPYNVTSMVWSGSSGVVVMAAPTNINLGFSIILSGAVNPDSTGNPNGYYVVSAFTDSQHFSVVVAPIDPSGSAANPHNGTMTGTPVFTSQNFDVYSLPGTVNFSGAGAGYFSQIYSIRFTSNNNIVGVELDGLSARLFDLSANTAVRIGCFGDLLQGGTWLWIAVNTAGTCGPVDDIVYQSFNSQIGGQGAHEDWRFSIDARWIGHTGYSAAFTSDSVGGGEAVPTYGPLSQIQGAFGHYPWAIAMSTHEGRMIGSGTAQWYATAAWIASTEPFSINQTIFGNGLSITYTGTASGFPYEIRPAISSLWGPRGGPGFIIGMSYEDLMHGPYTSTTPGDAGDVALGNFIQAGMGGGVPRPEMTGNDLRDLIYYVRRTTLQGSVGPTIQQPGADAADNAPPVFTAFSITRTNSTTIHATWSTDKLTIGVVGAASNAQFGMNSYPIFTDIESGYATTGHAVDLTVPAGLTPLNVQITAKTVAGLYSHTIPVSIA